MSNNVTFSNRNRNGRRNYNGGNGWGRPRWQRANQRSRRENIRSRRRASVRNGYDGYNSNQSNNRSNGYNDYRAGSPSYRSAARNGYNDYRSNNSRNNNSRNGNRPETGQCSTDNCNNRTPAHYLPLCNRCYFEKQSRNETAELRKDQVRIPAGMTDQPSIPAATPLPDIYPDAAPYSYTAPPVQATLIPVPEAETGNAPEDADDSAAAPTQENATEIPQTDVTVPAEPDNLFRKLAAYRSAYAQENGTQPRRAINDSVLREIATAMPDNSDTLAQVKGVGKTFMSRHGDAVLAIIGQD